MADDSPLTRAELERMLALLEEGHAWEEGVDSSFSRWSFENGAFLAYWFDQGRSGTSPMTKAEMVEQIVALPRGVRAFLLRHTPRSE